MSRPTALALDVNETLSDLAPMRGRFTDLGAPPELAATWFASVLRDGMALAALDQQAGFAEIGGEVLRSLLPAYTGEPVGDDAVQHVLEGFLDLQVHDDVPDGLRALHDLGIRLITLSNGATAVAEGLLERAGLHDLVSDFLTVADAGVWKPAAAAYAHATTATGIAPGELMLAAVHPWDVHGAQTNGLRGAWIDRTGSHWPAHFTAPEVVATDFVDLARQLTGQA
jgi:2-haloacid dehalogenase